MRCWCHMFWPKNNMVVTQFFFLECGLISRFFFRLGANVSWGKFVNATGSPGTLKPPNLDGKVAKDGEITASFSEILCDPMFKRCEQVIQLDFWWWYKTKSLWRILGCEVLWGQEWIHFKISWSPTWQLQCLLMMVCWWWWWCACQSFFFCLILKESFCLLHCGIPVLSMFIERRETIRQLISSISERFKSMHTAMDNPNSWKSFMFYFFSKPIDSTKKGCRFFFAPDHCEYQRPCRLNMSYEHSWASPLTLWRPCISSRPLQWRSWIRHGGLGWRWGVFCHDSYIVRIIPDWIYYIAICIMHVYYIWLMYVYVSCVFLPVTGCVFSSNWLEPRHEKRW